MAHESTADVGAPPTAYRWTCVPYDVGAQSGALVHVDVSLMRPPHLSARESDKELPGTWQRRLSEWCPTGGVLDNSGTSKTRPGSTGASENPQWPITLDGHALSHDRPPRIDLATGGAVADGEIALDGVGAAAVQDPAAANDKVIHE